MSHHYSVQFWQMEYWVNTEPFYYYHWSTASAILYWLWMKHVADLFAGQALIALGAGGIKPCVSAHVGDQFSRHNRHLLSKVFGWFYIAINLGAFISMLLNTVVTSNCMVHPLLLQFQVVLMLLATIVTFWSGTTSIYSYTAGWYDALCVTCLAEMAYALLARLSVIYLFVAIFWALFDQTGSSWVLQAQTNGSCCVWLYGITFSDSGG